MVNAPVQLRAMRLELVIIGRICMNLFNRIGIAGGEGRSVRFYKGAGFSCDHRVATIGKEIGPVMHDGSNVIPAYVQTRAPQFFVLRW